MAFFGLFGSKPKELTENDKIQIGKACDEVLSKDFAHELFILYNEPDILNPSRLGFTKKEDVINTIKIEKAIGHFKNKNPGFMYVIEKSRYWRNIFADTHNSALFEALTALNETYTAFNKKHKLGDELREDAPADAYYFHEICQYTQEKTRQTYLELLNPVGNLIGRKLI
jgi:hypothetical protein